MSGMELAFLPPDFKRLYVARINSGSAAEDCGLQVNDEILSINFKPVKDMDIDDIHSLFRSREGAGILIQILPYGTKRTEFVLMNLKRRI
jgi:C-terminal processing protease CtpA/Prc